MRRSIWLVVAVIASIVAVVVVGDSDEDEAAAPAGSTSTTEETVEDVPDNPTDPTTTSTTPDTACDQFRTNVVASARCDRLVRGADLTCTSGVPADTTTTEDPETVDEATSSTEPASDAATGCGPVPSAVTPTLVVGAVIGGHPSVPTADALQLGPGPGPTSLALVIRTGLPIQLGVDNEHTFVVRYERPGAPGCSAPGAPWDGAAFAAVLHASPGDARAVDLVCRGDGFAEISLRTTWFVHGDLAVVHLPIDLPGAPASVTGSFLAAPDFVAADRFSATRSVDPSAWEFDDPIEPS